MRIYAKHQVLETVRADLLVVNLFAKERRPGGGTGSVDRKLNGLVSKKIKELDFRGQNVGECFLFDNPKRGGAKQILVVSLGEKNKFNLEVVRTVAAVSLQQAKKQHAKVLATILHGAGVGGLEPSDCAQALSEGLLLADYAFDKYQKDKQKTNRQQQVTEVIICQRDKKKIPDVKRGIESGTIFANAQCFARNLVNEPPIHMTPKTLAETARHLAQDNPTISVKIFNKKQIKDLGMNAFLAVDSGSSEDPYFIHLSYKPKTAKKRIALIGKSITFDSGGLSLKPSDGMISMKMDMAGGAVVLGVFSALAKLSFPVEIHGLLAACENMPSGSAVKIGDVVTALNGKTIEILNTDAEGRLTLADALVYGERLKPDVMIDLATLTGAAVVALGEDITAVMTDDRNLAEGLSTASEKTGEKIWRLPLEPTYMSHLKSNFADMQNVGKSKGIAGVISAGLFLKNFVDKTPWAHLDIAGPAWVENKDIPYLSPGGSGWGVRLLLKYLLNL